MALKTTARRLLSRNFVGNDLACSVSVTRIESSQNRDFGLKIESKSIENRNLEIVTSLQIAIAFIIVTCSICCSDAVACRHRVCSSIICEFYISVLCEIVMSHVQFYCNRNKANTTWQVNHLVTQGCL